MMFLLLIGLLNLFASFDYTTGYGKGALNTHCVPMVPCHAIPQSGDPPTNVTFSSNCYTPSDPVEGKLCLFGFTNSELGYRSIFLEINLIDAWLTLCTPASDILRYGINVKNLKKYHYSNNSVILLYYDNNILL